MRVESMLNNMGSVGVSELKKVNQDSALKANDDTEKMVKVYEEYKAKATGDIASRNVTAQITQEEVTKYQIAEFGLKKQKVALENAKEKLSAPDITLDKASETLNDLVGKITEISDKTTYNGERLFEGNDGGEKFQVPSVRLGGKNFLPLHDLKIETSEDLTNAIATIDSAITKISNEINSCVTAIDDASSAVMSSDDFSYMDANAAMELMKSLKSEIYAKSGELMKAQNVEQTQGAM